MIGWAGGLVGCATIPAHVHGTRALSRRTVLFSAAAVLVPQAALAAIPTIDDYYGTEGGAKKKGQGYVAPEKGDHRNAALGEKKPADAQLISTLETSRETVEELRRLVRALSWDDVRSVLNKKLGIFMAGKDLKLDQTTAQVFGRNVRAATELCRDAAITVKRLNDVAFSNRIVYFNSVDRRQVSELADSMSIDLDEPLELLNSLDEAFEALIILKQ
eukprot:Plantae.Rhodophyta-Purpureofilum_apyrenoidigerum.ctg2774.p2 GENE.Plantae.Rhodophyta-Purpureofilum_apyrenoidigerum.ctg2774~~Plantae.Rhodophyta-Purpureofilum_apyrenoidigerum.ctg2774.p2  ORF type:complete len:217 (+),score=33.30 Plantae.Rhodophyta-Purpureofilum_apyrenoidigerum.ctg2774:1305-1955(+)